MFSEWISEIISFFVGTVAGWAVTISVMRNKADRGGTAASQSGKGVQQTGNIVDGDMAGRDVKKG